MWSMFCLFTSDRDPARPLFDKKKKHSDILSTAVVAHAHTIRQTDTNAKDQIVCYYFRKKNDISATSS